MKNFMRFVVLSLVIVVLTGCMQPTREIDAVQKVVDEVTKMGEGKYAVKEIKAINNDMQRAMNEFADQDKKFFKKFGPAKEMLFKVRIDAEAIKASMPEEKYRYDSSPHNEGNDDLKILEQAVLILRRGDTRLEELIADMINGVISYRLKGNGKR
jgi:hypothetical protein